MNSLAVIALAVIAHLSYYQPHNCATSPINCWNADYWWNMAAGTDARNWYEQALACPAEFAIGSEWRLPGVAGDRYIPPRVWRCLDRGGRIVSWLDGRGRIHVWLDLLVRHRIVGNTVQVIYFGPRPLSLLARQAQMAETCAGKEMC